MKKKIIFIILFIILLSYALLVGGTVPYFLLYTFLFFFLVPLVHILFILKKLELKIQVPETSLYSGNEITIKYEIDNNTFFNIPYLEIQSHITKELTKQVSKKFIENLRPYGIYSYEESITLKKRGYFPLGAAEVIISDIFGIFSLRRKYQSKTSLLVYPRPINISNFSISSVEQIGDLPIKDIMFQDKSRIANLRDFREGDNIKSIHWKLSAKLGQIIIKEYEKRGDAQVAIFLDNYYKLFKEDKNGDLEDKIVDIGLSLINYYVKENIPVHLYTQNKDKFIKMEALDSSYFKSFLEFFAYFQANGREKISNFITENMTNLNRDMTIIIITPFLDKSIGTLGIYLKTKGFKPIFILIFNKKGKEDYLQSGINTELRKEGIPLYILNPHSNIKEALEGKNG